MPQSVFTPPRPLALSHSHCSAGRLSVTHAGSLFVLACALLFATRTQAAEPAGSGPAPLDLAVIQQLAMPAGAEPPEAAATQQSSAAESRTAAPDPVSLSTTSVVPPSPAPVSEAPVVPSQPSMPVAPVATAPEAAPVTEAPEAPSKPYAGQPSPLDLAAIRQLAAPAVETKAAVPAQSAPAQPDAGRANATPPQAGNPAPPIGGAPTQGASMTAPQPGALPSGVTEAPVIVPAPTAVLQPANRQPEPLNAQAIGGLTQPYSAPARSDRPVPQVQMDVLRDVFAPEMSR